MATLRFRATIALNGINPYVPVSAARAARLKAGWRKPMPVRVRVDGKPAAPWRINLMPAGGGAFYLYLHETVRRASATAVGDTVAVELAFDENYRAGPADLPDWFERALARHAAARRGFAALIPSRQKEIVRYLANLKSGEAQQRNLAKILHVLSGGRGRFMARDWNSPSSRRKPGAASTDRCNTIGVHRSEIRHVGKAVTRAAACGTARDMAALSRRGIVAADRAGIGA